MDMGGLLQAYAVDDLFTSCCWFRFVTNWPLQPALQGCERMYFFMSEIANAVGESFSSAYYCPHVGVWRCKHEGRAIQDKQQLQ